MPRGNGGIIGPVNTSFSGVWSLTEAQLRRSGGTWPNFYAALLSESATGSDAVTGADTADPYFEYTTLLLPGNGTNGAQNNTFLDGSTNNFTITRNGNTTQGTFSPFSQTGWGNYFDGTGDWLSIPANSAFDFGTGDFTVECWFYYNTTPPATYDYLWAIGGNNTNGIALYINNGQPRIWNGSLILSTTGSISGFTWYHLAAVRSSGTLTVYLNGTSIGSVSLTSNLTGGASAGPKIAKWDGVDPEEFTGYISNFRIVKGVAVYTGAFTTPTSPLAATQSAGTNISAITGTQTSLLTCQSNRFIDNSTNNFTITVNGNTSVVAFSPFNPTASWSASTNGGSGYFDGSGDYLSVPDNAAFTMGSGDFTIEAWVYKTSTGRQYVIGQADSGGSNTATSFTLQVNASNKVQGEIFSSSTQYLAASTADITLNQWNHIAFVRDGNTLRIYINGVQDGTASVTGVSVNDSTNQVAIGRLGEFNGFYWAGYISSNRVLKGTCLYPNGTTFTPPTAPLTAITNTSLLLNFTNAGIYDATSKNDLETVGDAQLSNTTAKWGSTSIKFDGTGDYLQAPYQTLSADFGTGQFTIELWVYFSSSVSTTQMFVSSNYNASTGAGGWAFLRRGDNNTITFTQGSNVAYGKTWSPSLNTWYHCAVTRDSSNNLRIFVDGTQVGSTDASVTASINGATSLLIGTNQSTPLPLTGYIQDLRITKGYARYTANFTPPTAAFPTL